MTRYVVRRVFTGLLVIYGVLTLTFLIVHLLPGDAALALLAFAPKEYIGEMRHALGLDQPLHVQYVQWLVPLVTRLDLGQSLISHEPISELLVDRLPVTVELSLLSVLFGLIISLPLGIVAARLRGGWSGCAMQFSQMGQALPSFWIGTILFFVLAIKFQLLPSAGWVPLTKSVAGNLEHLLMPALSLALPLAAILTRTVRSSVLEAIKQDFVRTAHAKGLPPIAVLLRHVLRNGLIPVLTMVGVEMGYLLGGEVIIEDIFQLPGIGKLALKALSSRDIPVIQGALLFYGTFFVALNILVDILYSVVDPRIQRE